MLVPRRNQRNFLHLSTSENKPERKNQDLVANFTTLAASVWTLPQLLNGVAQGTNVTNRVGRKICVTSVQYRTNHNPFTVAVGTQCRTLIVYDKQANGALPAVTDILQLDLSNSPLNLANSERFHVICDEWSEPVAASTLPIASQRYIRCKLDTIFTGTAALIANITSGAILMLMSNNGATTAGTTNVNEVFARVRYTDA